MSTPTGTPAQSPAAANSKDSLVFDFINSLSPLETPKPLDAVTKAQLFKSSDLASLYPIFISPEVNPQRESRQIRDGSAQLSQEVLSPICQRIHTGTSRYIKLSGSTTIVSENSSIDCSLNDVYHDPPENTLGNGKKQNSDGKIDSTIGQEHTELSSICFEHSGLVKTETSPSGRNVQQNNLAKQYNGGLAECNSDQLITQGGSSVVPKSEISFDCEAQLANRTQKTGDVISNNSFLPINKTNLENSRKLFHGSFDYYNQSADCAADNIHGYCADGGGGAATNYDPRVAPGSSQSQLVSNHQIYGMLGVSSDYMPMHCNIVSQHPCGMRRRLFNEETRTSTMSLHSVSNLHPASSTTWCESIRDDNHLKPGGSPVCALPAIGFRLNALASISEDVLPYNTGASGDSSNNMPCTVNSRPLISGHNSQTKVISGIQLVPYSSEVGTHIESNQSSQITMPMITDEPGQESPKRRRRKLQNGDGDSCKRCSCKKSRCLKLYCECFAAKIYCSEYCSCRGCLNKHSHEETVLSTRKQTESRNPLAFAPKIISTCGSGQEIGEDSNKTPASARHKRGCNCKKSSCLKKYCECFQSGVGCSISCRCERCKNAFGIRKGVKLLVAEEIESVDKENNSHAKQEHTGNLPTTENLLTTPSVESCRSLTVHPSTCSRPPLSSARWNSRLNSQSAMKADVLISPVGSYAGMILGNSQEEGSSCTTNVKVVSPKKKGVSIPSFPSLTGDVESQ